MSLFRRLYDIARAEVHRHAKKLTGAEDQAKGHTWRQQSESARGRAHRTQTSGRAYDTSSGASSRRSQQDPSLAAHYAALEGPYGSDLATVKKAWKQLLRQYHPDLHGHDEEKRRTAEELTRGLNDAYGALEKHLRT